MSSSQSFTQLSSILKWRQMNPLPLDPTVAEGKWISMPLPTRRFGPNSWVSFTMSVVPGNEMTGPFEAWTVYDTSPVRVAAHLERPFSDTFGMVAPFELPINGFYQLSDEAMAALEVGGAAFFENRQLDEDELNGLKGFREQLDEPLWNTINRAFPDFFDWIRRQL